MILTSVYSRCTSRCSMSGGSELEQKVAAERAGGVTRARRASTTQTFGKKLLIYYSKFPEFDPLLPTYGFQRCHGAYARTCLAT